MQRKQKYVYIFLYALLSGTAAIFLSRDFLFWLLVLPLTFGKVLLFYAIGVLCIAVALLLLMVYTVHEVKRESDPLSFPNACKHVFRLLLMLFCMVPALLFFSVLRGLYSYAFFRFVSGIDVSCFPLFILCLFIEKLPAFANIFLLPFALHPFFSMLIHPRPIRETFRHALQTWENMYKPLLFWCTAIIAIQTAISLISSAMPHGFSEVIPIIFSAILQTAFFYKMLARYAREESAAQT